MTGFPVAIPYIRLSSPSIADIDMDEDLEIIVGGWSTSPAGEVIHIYHHNGTTLTGFPVTLPNNPSGNVNSTPTVGDIDGDGYPEIVLKAVNNIYAVNHNGTIVTGFPVFLNDENHSGTTSPTPALGDPDNDGQIEIIAAACYNTIMMIEQSGSYAAQAVQWGSYKSDYYNRGFYNPQPQTSLIVTLTPAQIPTIIPPGGGSFDFNIEISNHSGENQTFDVWTNATLPNGNIYGPIILAQNVTLPGNTTVDRDREQVVPGNAPAGAYFYNAYVGEYPDEIWDCASFPFSKSGDGD